VEGSDIVVVTAAHGFVDFLRDSLNISAGFATENVTVSLKTTEVNGYDIQISDDGIVISGNNGRNIAQGIYHLENTLKTRHNPFVAKGSINPPPDIFAAYDAFWIRSRRFPGRSPHQIARAGMDSVLYFTPDASDGTISNLIDLIERSAKYGIDVYLYSYILSKYHPDEPEAEDYYQNTYCVIFEKCKGLKVVILVVESCTFPSKDPDCEPGFYWQYYNTYAVPSSKPTSCDWPSRDYPEYLSFLSRIIRAKNPDADIVFWTYNFGTAPEEATKKLIRALPTDITLLVTFENWMDYPLEDVNAKVLDYTIAQIGPAQTFAEQAKIAKERGSDMLSPLNAQTYRSAV